MPTFQMPRDDDTLIELSKEFVNEHFTAILKDAVDEGFDGDMTEYIKKHAPKKFDKIFQDETMAKIFGTMGQQAIEEAAEAGKDIADVQFFGARLSEGDPTKIEPTVFMARAEVLQYYGDAIAVLQANRETEDEMKSKIEKLAPHMLEKFDERREDLHAVMNAFCADVWNLKPEIVEHDVRALGFLRSSYELKDLLDD